jgi:ABC-2 type transport system ATP-binding protein
LRDEVQMSVIEVSGVTVRYGRRTALDGVTLSLPNTATGLLGPNGAGKSTLMKALLGYLKPEAGTLRVLGMDMASEPLAVRHRLGYMPERDLMSPKVSAVSFLVYCGRLHGMTRPDAMERAHAVLNYVGLGEARYRKMETYSKGMCQRVKFAQAIIHDPKLLLLDEPTNGLDPDGRVEMLELIRDLARDRGIAVLLSTHLLPDVQSVCEYLAIIHEGRVVRAGPMNELTAYRGGEVEIRVHSNTPAYTAALERAGCTVKVLADGTLRVLKPDRVASRQLFVIAREQGTHIRQVKPIRQSLEDTFLEAIGHRSGNGSAQTSAPRQLDAAQGSHLAEGRA